ncbi:DUF5808 domain-containing protein [Flavobacterium sp. TAB 87]|uniref:DUF5808 domain-containing protein n=1 Tax=Flavobacterium sp. TAB 87 TaxID=1729581 RepID=UPI00076DBAD9|nr:DUF5808 domain-containing protein [Flavobacterium sp. TAB 87]KVV15901.1 putative membrane protein [Flavobacterium sp. TAB 87]
MKSEKPTPQDYENWTNDPDNWVWGLFYFNPKDDRIFPPKKIKWMGWTTNFANPHSVFAIIAILIILIQLSRIR